MIDHATATAPWEQSDTVVEACVADLRTLLDLRMDDYFRETQGLDALSEGLGLPVATVRELTYREVCGHVADRVPSSGANGSVVGTVLWPLTEPYRREYERYQQGSRFGPRDVAVGAARAKERPGAPLPAWYPFISYHMALVKLYGEDDTLMEALFNGLVESGCGSVILLHKYIHTIRGMTFIPREEIIYDLLVRPFLRPLVEDG